MKPHDYLRALMGNRCDIAIQFLCNNVAYYPHMCRHLQHFASANKELGQESYCESSFESESESLYCKSMLSSLAKSDDEQCLQQQEKLRETINSTSAPNNKKV